MDDEEEKKRKSRKRPSKKRMMPRFNATGGGILRQTPNYRIPYNNQRHAERQEVKTKVREDRWNGNSEIWSKPILPKQDKIVKQEIDTKKLLEELAEENEETLNKLSEQVEKSIESLKPLDAEDDLGAEAKVNENSYPSAPEEEPDVPEKIENEAFEPDDTELEELLDDYNEVEATNEQEQSPLEITDEIAIEDNEPLEDLEASQMAEDESVDFGSELVLFNPNFWREIGYDLWSQLEQPEPEIEAEIMQESEAMQ